MHAGLRVLRGGGWIGAQQPTLSSVRGRALLAFAYRIPHIARCVPRVGWSLTATQNLKLGRWECAEAPLGVPNELPCVRTALCRNVTQ